jgi:hypothetical protein
MRHKGHGCAYRADCLRPLDDLPKQGTMTTV